jgi:hypothetical protein
LERATRIELAFSAWESVRRQLECQEKLRKVLVIAVFKYSVLRAVFPSVLHEAAQN